MKSLRNFMVIMKYPNDKVERQFVYFIVAIVAIF